MPYFEGDNLTDDAILSTSLLSKIALGTTNARDIPKNPELRDADQVDYHSKNIRLTYPGCQPTTSTIFPDVVVHFDTFDHFGKTGVYFGIPRAIQEMIEAKLVAQDIKVSFDDPGVVSDEDRWWIRCGFKAAEEGKEYLFVVSENESTGELEEEAWPSFPEFFKQYGSSGLANVTCNIKMTTKTPVTAKKALVGTEEWKVSINVTRVNVFDLVDVPKPQATARPKSIAGGRDKARGKLAMRQKQLSQQGR